MEWSPCYDQTDSWGHRVVAGIVSGGARVDVDDLAIHAPAQRPRGAVGNDPARAVRGAVLDAGLPGAVRESPGVVARAARARSARPAAPAPACAGTQSTAPLSLRVW